MFSAVADEKVAADAMMPGVLAERLKECTRPGAMGGAFLTLAAILVAVGTRRLGRHEE